MNDRIRLAKAMGRGDIRVDGEVVWRFDPFTDANDDYAVLEWMREGRADKRFHMSVWSDFKSELASMHDTDGTSAYQIGDYARAALEVIDNE